MPLHFLLSALTLFVTPSASKAPLAAASPKYVFLRGDHHLSPRENMQVEAALVVVAKNMGRAVVPVETSGPALLALKKGILPGGKTCAAPPHDNGAVLAALQQDPLICPQGRCDLRTAWWDAECSEKWGACVLSVRFDGAPARDEESAPSDVLELKVSQEDALHWGSAGDLAQFIAASQAGAWRWGTPPRFSGVLGGLGMRGDGAPRPRLLSRQTRKTTVKWVPLWEVRGPATFWKLFQDPRNDKTVDIFLDPADMPCWESVPVGGIMLYARRSQDRVDLEVDAPQPTRQCLEGPVMKALAAQDPAIFLWNLRLETTPGDVLTPHGDYIIETSSNQERTQDPDWRKRKPKVSDPALESWHLPERDHAFKQCLVEFPFNESYALHDSQKRVELSFFFEVTFNPSGKATKTVFLMPARKGTPAEQLSPAARTCIEQAAMASHAPCTAKGGTARGWVTAYLFQAAPETPPAGTK